MKGLFKTVQVVIRPKNWWRIRLFMLRKLSDSKLQSRTKFLFTNLADALLKDAQRNPDVLLPVTRQLRRSGKKQACLDIADLNWTKRSETSAEWALSCARVWYDNGQVWRGDVALEHAKLLDPSWRPIFEEQARNQRWRGNFSISIEAAERALDLSNTVTEKNEWHIFLGMEYYKAARYTEARNLLSVPHPRHLSSSEKYALAYSLEQTGEVELATSHYFELEKRYRRNLPKNAQRARVHYENAQFSAALGALPTSSEEIEVELLRKRVLLQLGLFAEAQDTAISISSDPSILRLNALAQELIDEPSKAFTTYRDALLRINSKADRKQVLLQMSRAAFSARETFASAKAAFELYSSDLPNLNRLEAEVHPDFKSISKQASSAIRRGEIKTARELLRRLSMSASTPTNVRAIFASLGVLEFKLGMINEAAESFFLANPYKIPSSRDGNWPAASPSRLEEYAEVLTSNFPVKQVILYESFHGAKTACNPLAICQELLTNPLGEELEHVWAIQDGAEIHSSLLNNPKIHFVRVGSLGYLLHLASAKYAVNNSTFPSYYVRRASQRYINTWHGVPWKHLGNDVSDHPFGFANVARNFLQATDLLLPDEHTANILVRTQDLSDSLPYVPRIIGSPRVDTSLNMTPEARNAVLQNLGISTTAPTVLYAPTWRGNMESLEMVTDAMIEAIHGLAGLEINLIVRIHHFVAESLSRDGFPTNVFIAPDSTDTNELLGVTDVLVSDYSSLIFDFAVLERPIIKYVFDLEEYTNQRGLYFQVSDVPGVEAKNLSELKRTTIEAIELHRSTCSWNSFPTASSWQHEDGNASKRAVQEIFGELRLSTPALRKGPRVLISLGGLNPNGITRSIRSLMATLPTNSVSIRTFISSAVLSNPTVQDTAKELHNHSQFTVHMGLGPGTRQEGHVWKMLTAHREPISGTFTKTLANWMQRERRRYFGETYFDAVLDFDGYGTYPAALLSLGFPGSTRSGFLLHSEFMSELSTRFPSLASIGPLLNHFDRIASVSAHTAQVNQKELSEAFDLADGVVEVLPNAINVSEIREYGRQPLSNALSEWFATPRTHIVIVGRLSIEKNHESALRALKVARDLGADIDLVIVGSGPRFQAISSLCNALGLQEYVHFTGQVPNPYPAIKAASALLLPSTHEGQPLVLLEALTLQTPVIATRIPGSIAVLENGGFGELVELNVDAIAAALVKAHENQLSPSSFDPEAYLRSALESFQKFII